MPTATVSGRTLHYVETGGGPPTVIFIHGAGGGWGTWTRQLEGVADAGRMIALDLPGHGASPGDGCRAVADYAALVRLLETDYPAATEFVKRHAWSPATAPALAEGMLKATLEVRQAVTLGDYAACNVFELRNRVAGIRLPTLVIVGEDDELTPPKFSEFLVSEIPGARLVRVAKAGHYVPLEQPDEVNLAIRQFLAALT